MYHKDTFTYKKKSKNGTIVYALQEGVYLDYLLKKIFGMKYKII
jgi:hypothetical protein